MEYRRGFPTFDDVVESFSSEHVPEMSLEGLRLGYVACISVSPTLLVHVVHFVRIAFQREVFHSRTFFGSQGCIIFVIQWTYH